MGVTCPLACCVLPPHMVPCEFAKCNFALKFSRMSVWPAHVQRPSPCLTAARLGGKGWLCPALLGREGGSMNALSRSSVMLVKLPELLRGCMRAVVSCSLSRGAALQGPSYPVQGPQGPWQMPGQRLQKEGSSALSSFPTLVFQGLLKLAVASNCAVC